MRVWVSAWTAAMLALGGCGGPSSSPAGGAGSGGTGMASAGSGGKAGSSGMAGSSTQGGTAAGGSGTAGSGTGGQSGSDVPPVSPDATGSITIFASLYRPGFGVDIQAQFPLVQDVGSNCTTEAHGDCEVFRCPNLLPILAPHEHVGTITVDSAAAEVHAVITPDAEGTYAETVASMHHFLGGEAVTVTASGGTLPAFTLEAQFALVLLVQQPPATPAGALLATATWPRVQPGVLSWTRGVPNVNLVVQTQAELSPQNDYVGFSCAFDSMAGTATVDAAVLSAMPTGTIARLFTSWGAYIAPDNANVFVVAEAAIEDRSARVEITLE